MKQTRQRIKKVTKESGEKKEEKGKTWEN